MIPLGDSLAPRRRPVVTVALIAACAVVFLYELTLRPTALEQFTRRWGAVPSLVIAALGAPSHAELLTLVTSQFVHAGPLHIAGNMLFLWVFGRAVEDRLGWLAYLVFYLLAGAAAGLVECLLTASSSVPLIGASGAIAAVLGVYFVCYPGAWVRVLVPVLFFFWAFDLPALLVLAFWFASQFLNGVSALGQTASDAIAVWAHIAGFVIGCLFALLLPRPASPPAPAAAGRGLRRADVPGPARLISSVADLLALLLLARLALRFFALGVAASPLAALAGPVLAVTNPLVLPFAEFLPAVRIPGGLVELPTLAALLATYLLAGLLSQLFLQP